MSHWNYRIVRVEADWLAVYEVYYDDDGKPTGRTEDPADISGDGEEELVREFRHVAEAFTRPILDDSEIGK